MKNLLTLQGLQSADVASLGARLFTAAVLFPHGAQKLLGWWDGFGYRATMNYFSNTLGMPDVLGLLVILIEFFSPLLLLVGLFTRAAAIAILIVMGGIITTVQHQYFFMNWFGAQKGEGMEFFLLMIGLCLVCIFNGSGKYAIDYYINTSGHEK